MFFLPKYRRDTNFWCYFEIKIRIDKTWIHFHYLHHYKQIPLLVQHFHISSVCVSMLNGMSEYILFFLYFLSPQSIYKYSLILGFVGVVLYQYFTNNVTYYDSNYLFVVPQSKKDWHYQLYISFARKYPPINSMMLC